MWSKCTPWPDYWIYVVDIELVSSLANYCIGPKYKHLGDCVVELKPFLHQGREYGHQAGARICACIRGHAT